MSWLDVCPLARLTPGRGIAVLVPDGSQVAVFRTADDALFATDNVDPASGTGVLSRGIVGSRGDVATITSPMHKQVFDLRTGQCLDDDALAVVTYPVRLQGGVVQVGV